MEVAPVIDAAVDAIRPTADAHGVDLVVDAEPGPRISGDADRLRQVIWNLLSNAVKFTPPKGRVSIGMRTTGQDVEVEVTDTGIGIAPDFLPFVFDRFRQADASTTRAHGGLGLGLAIVRHLVEAHGGTVTAHSQGEGAGARFVVRLPAVERAAGTDQAVPGVERRGSAVARKVQQSLKGVRVLVVDDEDDTREVVRMTLMQYGATVATASRVAEAMRMFGEFTPHAVVADIGMPGEDGYSLARRIRQLPREGGGAIPLVALTAYARSQDRDLAFEAGFNEHLAKPVEPSELAWAVVSLVRKNQAAG
jgi:CheY-like chemotaxis protein